MTHTNGPLARRAGPILGAVLLVAATLAVAMPIAPGATATDPTPAPSDPPVASPEPTADPTPLPTPDPTPVPSADPTQAPTPDPTPPPDPSPAPEPTPEPTPATSPEPSPSELPGPSPEPSLEPSPSLLPTADLPFVGQAWVEVVDPDTGALHAGEPATAFAGLERFRVYQLRFQVVNPTAAELTVDPTLEVGREAEPTAFSALPTAAEADVAPFYLAPDDGRLDRPRTAVIARDSLRLDRAAEPSAVAVDGLGAYGADPRAVLVLPAHAYTEVVFAVRATAAAPWRSTWTFRLALGVEQAPDAATVRVSLAAKPRIALSPGQRRGRMVEDPVPLYRLRQPKRVDATAAAARTTEATVSFALAAPAPIADPFALAQPFGPAATTETPHEPVGLRSDTCAACHSGHAAQAPLLLRDASPASNLCFRCHDGSGATSDILGQYADPAVPANDPATDAWYSHPATSPSDHTTDREDEFGGRLDRHATCADCHQPHLSNADPPIGTTTGWTASGTIKGASGVSVVNGAAGSSPTYRWNLATTLEYELCFKCHSGFTQLLAGDPAHPSRWSLDKGVELNPANASYHPVEAAGRNATGAMSSSLAGTSPYKLWTFQTDSTIRCVNCHGDSRLAAPGLGTTADAQLAPHSVPNRGLLMAPYRDRDLKPAGEPYGAADFALCFQCHAESPMVDFSGDTNSATNYRYHGFHLTAIDAEGVGGRDIDRDGDGEGNAVCAECHFRIHGSTEAVDGQADNARLVNFAPNVQPYRGVLSWTGGASGGTCTLVCHGVTHSAWRY